MAEWVYWLRLYTVVLAALVAIVGTLQVRRWKTFLPQNQMAWLALAVLNFAVGYGSLQSLLRHIQGGDRTSVIAGAVTLELAAVLWQPAHDLIRWRTARRLIRRGK